MLFESHYDDADWSRIYEQVREEHFQSGGPLNGYIIIMRTNEIWENQVNTPNEGVL